MSVGEESGRVDNAALFAELTELDPAARVIMYCRSWCSDCRRAKAWLDEHGVPYLEVDVDKDPSAREKAAAFNEGRLHTPTFLIGGDVCVDFRPERLTEMLDMM